MKISISLAAIALLLGIARVDAQPAYTAQAAGETAGATTVTTSTSITATGLNRYLICGIALDHFDAVLPTVTGPVTFSGVDLTFRQAEDYYQTGVPGFNAARIEIWALALEGVVAPSAVSTVTATLDQSAPAAIGCVLYTGVDQTTPTGTLVAAGNRTSGSTVTVSSSVTEVVVDFVSVNMQIEALKTATAGGSQTQRIQQRSSVTNFPPAVLISESVGAASVVPTWTWDDATNFSWTVIGVPLLPAAAGGGGTGTGKLLLLGVGGHP